METVYFNGAFLPKNEVSISPDDRGFLFADGIYEVIRWYQGFFYDLDGHMTRLKRSLDAIRISWPDYDSFRGIAAKLITKNILDGKDAMVYLQVTRGAARRSHSFPGGIAPTVYAYAWSFKPDIEMIEKGISVIVKEDIRWSRCDIKSIALLPNTISFQEACEHGSGECIFMRNGYFTEGSHSNVFFVSGNELFTHPESNLILSGITRKNIIRIAREEGFTVHEDPLPSGKILSVSEAFISNTSSEIMPVIKAGDNVIGNGKPGRVTLAIRRRFEDEIKALRG